jgi:parallel beta-helix repeat protein
MKKIMFLILVMIALLGAEEVVGNIKEVQKVYVSNEFVGETVGTKKAPFKSLDGARKYIRGVDDSVDVIVMPGHYFFSSKGFSLNREDSGNAQKTITYRSLEANKAKLYGGITLLPKNFKKLKDDKILSRLSKGVADKILTYDLSGLDLKLSESPQSYKGTPPAPWLYFEGKPMILARWPNAGNGKDSWATFTKATDTGLPNPESENPVLRTEHPGSFIFEGNRPEKWNIDDGVWLLGYWTHDWSEEVLKIDSYDKTEKEIKLAGIHGYGIASGTWGNSKRRFFAQNLLEELDSLGEWYVDRQTEVLYFYPPNNINHHEIYLATLTEPIIKVENATDIIFSGFDIGYGHGNGINLRNTRSVCIYDCKVANLGGSGINVNGYSNTVSSCELYNLGLSGIRLSGGSREKLIRADNLAFNNHIHHFGMFQRTYAPGIGVNGCGQVVQNNLIHDAPHSAVLYGGNEHLFEKNEIHSVVLETRDAGAFYTGRDWGSQGTILRYNYIHDLGLGNTNHANTMGIYLDDCDSGETLEGNVLVNVGRGFMIGGGRDNIMINNIVFNCIMGMSIDSRGKTCIVKKVQSGEASWQLQRKVEKMNYREPPWSDAYPSLANIMNDSPTMPLHNVITNNAFINCSKEAISISVPTDIFGQLLVTNNITNSKINPHGDVNGFEKFENNKLTIEELAKERGIPLGEIGMETRSVSCDKW